MEKLGDKIELDGEIADLITAQTLRQHMAFMMSELGADEVGEKPLHPVDRARYKKLVQRMGYLLTNYFGRAGE